MSPLPTMGALPRPKLQAAPQADNKARQQQQQNPRGDSEEQELRREWLSCQGVVDAQLDAYVGGSGEWATGADDDDDYEDECVAETWRDGGVLSEADA